MSDEGIWGAKVGSSIHLNRKAAIVFIEAHRQPNFTFRLILSLTASDTKCIIL